MREEPTTGLPAVPPLEQVIWDIVADSAPPRPAPKPEVAA